MTKTSVPQTHPPGTGWMDWCWTPPPYGRLVETWRREWQDVEVLRVGDQDPLFNVANLYWRRLSRPRLEPEVR